MTWLFKGGGFILLLCIISEMASSSESLILIPFLKSILQEDGPKTGASAFLKLWSQGLRLQKDQGPNLDPQTILAPLSRIMSNLVPMDAANPLYSADSILRRNFLSDHMLKDRFDVRNMDLTGVDGVSILNVNGKTLVFKKDSTTGKTTVNDIEIESINQLNDTSLVYILKDTLFNYKEKVRNAFQTLAKVPSKFGPLGIPLVPQLKDSLKDQIFNNGGSSLVNLWKTSIRTQNNAVSNIQPKTFLSSNLINLVPMDAPNPLYADSDLRRNYLFDHMLLDKIDIEKLDLSGVNGVAFSSLNGKNVVFKKEAGTYFVNGVEIEGIHKLSDEVILYKVKDVLFNYKEIVQKAFQELLKQPSRFGPLGSPKFAPTGPT